MTAVLWTAPSIVPSVIYSAIGTFFTFSYVSSISRQNHCAMLNLDGTTRERLSCYAFFRRQIYRMSIGRAGACDV